MVIQDLSSSNSPQNFNFTDRLAAPTDRLLSFFFDLLIFSPVASLATVGLLKDLKEMSLMGDSTQNFFFTLGLYGISFLSLFVLMQALFLHFWQVTPGQRFLCLEVKNLNESVFRSRSLSLFQCLVLSFGPWFHLFFLGIPALEILSHPLRRTWTDRLSDTLVLTRKTKGVGSPLALETRFVRQWMQMTALFFVLIGVLQLPRILRLGTEISGGVQTSKKVSCPEVLKFQNQRTSKLDRALTLFIAKKEFRPCVVAELDSDQIFKKEPELSYFAQLLLTSDERLKKKYAEELCSRASSETGAQAFCQWAQNSLEKSTPDRKVASPNTAFLSLRTLSVLDQVNRKQWLLAFENLDFLVEEKILFEVLQPLYVKTYLSLGMGGGDISNQNGESSQRKLTSTEESAIIKNSPRTSLERKPSSINEDKSKIWIRHFQERYGVQ